jgi:hypothetical protein
MNKIQNPEIDLNMWEFIWNIRHQKVKKPCLGENVTWICYLAKHSDLCRLKKAKHNFKNKKKKNSKESIN